MRGYRTRLTLDVDESASISSPKESTESSMYVEVGVNTTNILKLDKGISCDLQVEDKSVNPLGPRGQIWDTYVSCVNEFTRVSTLAATWFYSSFSC